MVPVTLTPASQDSGRSRDLSEPDAMTTQACTVRLRTKTQDSIALLFIQKAGIGLPALTPDFTTCTSRDLVPPSSEGTALVCTYSHIHTDFILNKKNLLKNKN